MKIQAQSFKVPECIESSNTLKKDEDLVNRL